jgi:hypothetical protein
VDYWLKNRMMRNVRYIGFFIALLGLNFQAMAQDVKVIDGLGNSYQSCINHTNFHKLKDHISAFGIRPDEVGDPSFESIFCANNEWKVDLASMAGEGDLQLMITSKDTADRFTYSLNFIVINSGEEGEVLLSYESAESHLVYMELQEKYQLHFCDLIEKIIALEKK